jgi:nicotinamide riboside kinase
MSNIDEIKKIVVTGPENSGKTTLVTSVANLTPYQPRGEMARSYLKGKGNYGIDDLHKIGQLQLEQEKMLVKNGAKKIICDTDEITLKIWSRLKLGEDLDGSILSEYRTDLYLLCYPDIPVELDPLREDMMRRDMLFDLYLNELMHHRLPFVIIRGSKEIRLKYTLQHINTL